MLLVAPCASAPDGRCWLRELPASTTQLPDAAEHSLCGCAAGGVCGVQGTHQEISIPESVEALTTAGKVLIVPGYGLAVANAQHSIAELTKALKKKGVEVSQG